jgi:acetyl-CoA decarbonylase/synthase complex subunit beta
MLHRYVDPSKINVRAECLEFDDIYLGERVKGKRFRGFELVTPATGDKQGIEVTGELDSVIGIWIEVYGISDEAAMALEALIGETVNRFRGVEYKFRKENVEIIVSEEAMERFTPDCLAKVLHDSFTSIPGVKRVRVRLILDRDEFEKARELAAEIHRRREEYKVDEEEVAEFYACISCQHYLPNHVCIISPDRPSPCGTLWLEAKAAEELQSVHYYSRIEKGDKTEDDEFSGVDAAVRKITDGKVEKIKLHSVLSSPPLAGLYSEAIVFYIPEKDGFGIVDRNYKKRTPIGLTFDEMERIIAGQQVEGFVGISIAYMKSGKFLRGEGGWRRVVWVSPEIYIHISGFLSENLLKRIEVG